MKSHEDSNVFSDVDHFRYIEIGKCRDWLSKYIMSECRSGTGGYGENDIEWLLDDIDEKEVDFGWWSRMNTNASTNVSKIREIAFEQMLMLL